MEVKSTCSFYLLCRRLAGLQSGSRRTEIKIMEDKSTWSNETCSFYLLRRRLAGRGRISHGPL